MPLLFAPQNTPLKIVKIRGEAALLKHLSALGILKGGEITLIGSACGSAICMVKDGRIGLDHATSMAVEVLTA